MIGVEEFAVSKGAEIRERLALVRPIWRVGGPGGRDVRWNDASCVAKASKS